MAENKMLNYLDEMDDSGSGGTGKGVFTRVKIISAVKTFARDIPQEQTMFEYDPADKVSYEKAVQACSNVLKAAGLDATANNMRPTKVIGFICRADAVIGSVWKQDLTKLIPTWTSGWVKEVAGEDGKKTKVAGPAKEALAKLAEQGKFTAFGKEYWSHIKVILDPSGRKDKSGERTETIWYVDEIYPDEATMRKAAEEAGAGQEEGGSNGPIPEGWPPEVWAQYRPQIMAKIGDNWSVPHLATVGKEFDLTADFLKQLKPA
jgi:hypothetical protein